MPDESDPPVPELPPDVFAAVEKLCAEGDDRAADDDYDGALDRFRRAWDLLPEPKAAWSATLWLLVAVGDVHYLRGAFAEGRDALDQAVDAFPEAPENPVLCLRLGQCHLELGDETPARRWLTAALAAAGDEADDLFDQEDPKYLRFLDQTADRAE